MQLTASLAMRFTFPDALASFLYVRALCSESSSTTSAIDLCTPFSPYGPAASRQPSGCTPYYLPSSATKIRARLHAKAGQLHDPPEHRLASGVPTSSRLRVPAVALDQRLAQLLHARTSSLGNRWTAGGTEHIATKAAVSTSATARASKLPIRCWITCGPANASPLGLVDHNSKTKEMYSAVTRSRASQTGGSNTRTMLATRHQQ